METKMKKTEKFSQSITVRAFIIGFLTLFLLIPSTMIQSLIRERQYRSKETIEKINDKWSHAQTICGPYLSVPYSTTYKDADDKLIKTNHILNIAPEKLNINTRLYPEERYYGIYKTILYKSDINFSGEFIPTEWGSIDDSVIMYWEKSYLTLGLSDLRGITTEINFVVNGESYTAEAAGSYSYSTGNQLIISLDDQAALNFNEPMNFKCEMKLNGSSDINYIPLGKTTRVQVAGAWGSPGFIGNFSPEHTITNEGFIAEWNILRFNRNIPEMWQDNLYPSFHETSFGINLVDPVDHYQQNMRSAKYALMFIALTFVVFFFVEILTQKRIHPIQYLLVGIALILFYSLLLSISEQIGFGWAYLISTAATILLISLYAHSIFKNKIQSIILVSVLAGLYLFLYVILQLEDIALLIGSLGLFIILGVIMYFSHKIQWYKQPLEREYLPPIKDSVLPIEV